MAQRAKKKKRHAERIKSTGRQKAERPVLEDEDEFAHLGDDGPERDRYMTVGDHLEELRRRLIAILILLTVGTAIAFFFSNEIHRFLLQNYEKISDEQLILHNVYGGLEVLLKLSFTVALTVTFPFCLYITWGFITPAVTRRIAFMGHLLVFCSALLFWSGIAVSHFYVLPASLEFLFGSTLPYNVAPLTTVEKYYTFVFFLLMGGGLTFQLPLIIVVSGALEILTVAWHRRTWKYGVVIIMLLSALITPPDPMSMAFLGGILFGLYAISVGIVWIIEKIRDRRRRRDTSGQEL